MVMDSCKLKDIGKVCMCKRILKEQTSETYTIPFYKISTFGGVADTFISRELYEEYKSKYSYPKPGAILLSAAGTLGKTVVFDGRDAYFQDSNIVWINNDETRVINDYLQYYYSIIKWNKTTGSTIDRLYNDNIEEAVIFYPRNIEEQRKVSKILKLIDEKIENNNKINDNLAHYLNDIYVHWFLQFDFPNKEGRPYKASGGKLIWNEELKRAIPVNWGIAKLGSIFTSERGISYSTRNISSGKGNPMINLANFAPGGGAYKSSGLKHFDGTYVSNKVLKPYDLVICNTQQTAIDFDKDIIGRAMLVPDIFDEDILSSHHVNVIHPHNPLLKEYLLFLFNSDCFHKYISGHTNGTNILGLVFSGVEDYKTEIPPDYVLETFSAMVLKAEAIKSSILRENRSLCSIRQFLMPMLMSGQATIAD